MVYFLHMKISIETKQIQKQTLSPVMQQSIEVLLLPLAELNTAIDQELQENPLLEVDEQRTLQERNSFEEIVNQNIKRLSGGSEISSSNYNANIVDSNVDDEDMEEKLIEHLPTLEDYLFDQLRLEVTDPQEFKIGELIIGNLNEDGYLTLSCEEITQALQLENMETVEHILKIIQNFDPLGIASRSLKECLLAQVSDRCNTQSDIIRKIIERHLEELGSSKKFPKIAKTLKVSVEAVREMVQKIGTLEPKPSRKYSATVSNLYIKPDIFITKDGDSKYKLRINKSEVPFLRVSQVYQNMLKQSNRTSEEIEFIREKIKNALFFIKSIEQRHQTIERIALHILQHQKNFFDQGHMALKPMTLKDVGASIDRNESTVSRAISNKYMDTPQGLLPLKFFFSQAISNGKQNIFSNRSIKEEMRVLVEEEDRHKPLTDQEIQGYFEEKGMKIARRTISKYRQALKILPSHLRKF